MCRELSAPSPTLHPRRSGPLFQNTFAHRSSSKVFLVALVAHVLGLRWRGNQGCVHYRAGLEQ
jgi:hypothetical protein